MSKRRTHLPGVGEQYDFTTHGGRHLSVVVHLDGRRFLGFYDPEDPDNCRSTVPLEPDEASSLASIISPDFSAASALHAGELELDLVTERIPVSTHSPYRGRPLGHTRARTRTGTSIVAVLRRTGAIPSPGPQFRLEAGDTLLVVGTREGADDLANIISGD